MKILVTLTAIIFLALTGTSCSKKLPPKETSIPSKAWDLGVIELSDHQSQTNHLGNNRDCVVTFVKTPENNIEIRLMIEGMKSDGSKEVLAKPKIITAPGHAVAIAIGDIGITFTPKLKTN